MHTSLISIQRLNEPKNKNSLSCERVRDEEKKFDEIDTWAAVSMVTPSTLGAPLMDKRAVPKNKLTDWLGFNYMSDQNSQILQSSAISNLSISEKTLKQISEQPRYLLIMATGVSRQNLNMKLYQSFFLFNNGYLQWKETLQARPCNTKRARRNYYPYLKLDP